MASARSLDLTQLDRWILDGTATKQELSIRAIKADHRIQSRVEMVPEHTRMLAEVLDRGEELRPVVSFYDQVKDRYILADGFHRLDAHKAKRRVSISSYVVHGTARDAMLYSVGANLRFSLAPTREDKKKAVLMLLSDPEYFQFSDREIASRCGLSSPVVARHRRDYCREQGIDPPEKVLSAASDGGSKVLRTVNRVGHHHKPTYRVEPAYRLGERDECGHKLPIDEPRPAYLAYKSQARYLGRDSPEAKAKFERQKAAILAQEEERKRFVTFNKLLSFLQRRSGAIVPVQNHWPLTGHLPGIRAFTVNGLVCTVAEKLDPSTLPQSVGRALLARQLYAPDHRAVIVCWPQIVDSLTDACKTLGVDLMTPEQITEHVLVVEKTKDAGGVDPEQ